MSTLRPALILDLYEMAAAHPRTFQGMLASLNGSPLDLTLQVRSGEDIDSLDGTALTIEDSGIGFDVVLSDVGGEVARFHFEAGWDRATIAEYADRNGCPVLIAY